MQTPSQMQILTELVMVGCQLKIEIQVLFVKKIIKKTKLKFVFKNIFGWAAV